jgi:hypothetical protein
MAGGNDSVGVQIRPPGNPLLHLLMVIFVNVEDTRLMSPEQKI